MNLMQVSFPVYKLSENPPNQIDGVTFYLSRDNQISVVDDRNIEADTLARRRIILEDSGAKLFKLKHALFFIADLVKLAKPGLWFIDSSGKCFIYTKTKLVPLVFKRITRVHRGDGSALIEAEGLDQRFRALYAPLEGQHYAGFLKLGRHSYLLYGFFDKKYDATTRKI